MDPDSVQTWLDRDREADDRDRLADDRDIDYEIRQSLADERERVANDRERVADERDNRQDRREARQADRERQADSNAAARDRVAHERDQLADSRDRAADERDRMADQREIDAELGPDARLTTARQRRATTLATKLVGLRQRLATSAMEVARVSDALAATHERRSRWDAVRAVELQARAATARSYAETEREAARRFTDQ